MPSSSLLASLVAIGLPFVFLFCLVNALMLDVQLAGSLQGHNIDGRFIASWIRARVKQKVDALHDEGVALTLAVLRVGNDPASERYVNGKIKACGEVGIASRHLHMPADASEEAVLAQVRALNEDPDIDAILVQLPLPPQVNEIRVMDTLDPMKDADGFHPKNLGRLFQRFGLVEPCTPIGIMVTLRAIGAKLEGARALVIGRSVIVGRPVADMLVRANATVTIAHRHTQHLEEEVRRADIVISATGVYHLVKGDWIKPGAVVIDVGQNRSPEGTLAGDVEYDVACKNAAAITPVPGGVGPMTIAMLLWNTVIAALQRRHGHEAALAFRWELTDFKA